jgi:molybdopterin-containing oxidoreductase family iron-sulfur binding subunit
VRRFNYFNFTRETPELVELAQNPDVTVRTRGVIEKCTYCTQRINAAKIEARLADRAVTDNDFQTACEQACPSGAIVFGDIRDPESRISASRASDRTYVLLEELNNRPRTTFQAKLRNPHPRRQDR